ncbi:MAG: Transglycosylase-associated protein, partial [uncultured Nocardioidaceae bacterium]
EHRQRLHRHPGRHRHRRPGPVDHPRPPGHRLDPHVRPRPRRRSGRRVPRRGHGRRGVVAGPDLPGRRRRGPGGSRQPPHPQLGKQVEQPQEPRM